MNRLRVGCRVIETEVAWIDLKEQIFIGLGESSEADFDTLVENRIKWAEIVPFLICGYRSPNHAIACSLENRCPFCEARSSTISLRRTRTGLS